MVTKPFHFWRWSAESSVSVVCKWPCDEPWMVVPVKYFWSKASYLSSSKNSVYIWSLSFFFLFLKIFHLNISSVSLDLPDPNICNWYYFVLPFGLLMAACFCVLISAFLISCRKRTLSHSSGVPQRCGWQSPLYSPVSMVDVLVNVLLLRGDT